MQEPRTSSSSTPTTPPGRSSATLAVSIAAVVLTLLPLAYFGWWRGGGGSTGVPVEVAVGTTAKETHAAKSHPVTGETGDETLQRMQRQLAAKPKPNSEALTPGGPLAIGGAVPGARVDRAAGAQGPIDGGVQLGGSAGDGPNKTGWQRQAAIDRAEAERKAYLAPRGGRLTARAGTKVVAVQVERLSNPGATAAVRNAAAGVPGFRDVSVNAGTGMVYVRVDQSSALTAEQLAQRISAAGYPATSLPSAP